MVHERALQVEMPCASGFSCRGAGPAAEQLGVRAAAADITPAELKRMLTFPEGWGPTEWGALGAGVSSNFRLGLHFIQPQFTQPSGLT